MQNETLLARYIFHKLSLLWRNICNHNINVSAFSTIIPLMCAQSYLHKSNTIVPVHIRLFAITLDKNHDLHHEICQIRDLGSRDYGIWSISWPFLPYLMDISQRRYPTWRLKYKIYPVGFPLKMFVISFLALRFNICHIFVENLGALLIKSKCM